MSVNLFDLVEPLKQEVNPPGSDLFPEATDDNYLGSLTNAFWEIRLYGMFVGFEENAAARGGPLAFAEGIITPVGIIDDTYDDPIGYVTGVDLSREMQQLMVLWAGYKIVLTRMSAMNTVFRAKAGPVEYETQNAATVLTSVLDQIKDRLDLILTQIGTSNASVLVMDAIIERTYSQAMGDTWFVR
jgi:hypothetical protein